MHYGQTADSVHRKINCYVEMLQSFVYLIPVITFSYSYTAVIKNYQSFRKNGEVAFQSPLVYDGSVRQNWKKTVEMKYLLFALWSLFSVSYTAFQMLC